MKKVIDGALYNTETAQKLGWWDNGELPNNFEYLGQQLYKTKSGKYFLYVDTCFSDKDYIKPLTLAEATEWAEKYLTGDDYIKIFGEPEEAGENKVALNLSLRPENKAKLERMKQESGLSISAIIERIVEAL